MKKPRFTKSADGVMRVTAVARVRLTRNELRALRRNQLGGRDLNEFCESLLNDELGRLFELQAEIDSENNSTD